MIKKTCTGKKTLQKNLQGMSPQDGDFGSMFTKVCREKKPATHFTLLEGVYIHIHIYIYTYILYYFIYIVFLGDFEQNLNRGKKNPVQGICRFSSCRAHWMGCLNSLQKTCKNPATLQEKSCQFNIKIVK